MSWRYHRVYSRLWDDERFGSLGERGQRVALYLLTSSQGNGLGFFRFSPGKAAEDLLLSTRTFAIAFEEVLKAMEWRFDPVARVVLLPKFFKYNSPDNPNCLKAWLRELSDLPNSHLFEEFAQAEQHFSENLQPVFRQAITEHRGQRSGERSRQRRVEPSGPPNPSPNPNPKPTPNTPPVVLESFERDFWNLYPSRNGRKLGKPSALRLWQKLTEADRQQVAIAVKHYVASPDVQRGIGIKDPARWLKTGKGDEPWRDYIQPAATSGMNGQGRTMRFGTEAAHGDIDSKNFREGAY